MACLLALTALLIAIDAALTLLYLHAGREEVGALRREDDPATIVNRFYVAVDDALQTGDTASVARLLAPEFAEFPTSDGKPLGSADLLTAIARLRAIAPAARVQVESASTLNGTGEVTVRLTVTGTATASFLGLAPPAELSSWGWGPVETLRVSDGLVVARWSAASVTAGLEALAVTALPAGASSAASVAGLARLILGAYATLTVANGEATRFFVVETGTLAITPVVQPADTSATGVLGQPSYLGPGEYRLTLPGEHYLLASAGAAPLSVLVAERTTAPGATDPSGIVIPVARLAPLALDEAAAGVGETQLAAALLPRMVDETFALGRVTLAPAASLTWPETARPLLLALDGGELQIAAPSPGMTGARADGSAWSGNTTLLVVGDGVLVHQGAPMTWRATGDTPTVALVLAVGSPARALPVGSPIAP